MRTPLAAARAKAQRLAERAVDDNSRQDAEALVRQLDRLARVATRLLQMARIESGATLQRKRVDLALLARMIVADFADDTVKDRIRIEETGPAGNVMGDIDAIGIALRNLIENALNTVARNAGSRCSWSPARYRSSTMAPAFGRKSFTSWYVRSSAACRRRPAPASGCLSRMP